MSRRTKGLLPLTAFNGIVAFSKYIQDTASLLSIKVHRQFIDPAHHVLTKGQAIDTHSTETDLFKFL